MAPCGERRSGHKFCDHVLFPEQIRNLDCKIYPDMKHDHPGQHDAAQSFREIRFKFQAHFSQQFNNQKINDDIELPSNHITRSTNFLQDVSQAQKVNRFSEASKKLIAARSVLDREIFEHCEFNKISTLRLQFLYVNRNKLLQLCTKFEDFTESHNIF